MNLRFDLALPAEVRDRLALHGDDSIVRGITCLADGDRHLPAVVEERTAERVTVRTHDDGTIGVHGYASVTNIWYDVAGGPPYGWREMIVRGAFAKALAERDDVRFLIEHEGLALARTAARTLTLEEDDHGLLADVPALDVARNVRAAELVSTIDRGDVDQMSFAFRVLRQEWNDDYTERVIREVKLYDVSAVSFPANTATIIALRAANHPARRKGHPLSLARAEADRLRLRA
jgi:hypothetical protein